MANDAFKDIAKLEADLWEAADNLRANSIGSFLSQLAYRASRYRAHESEETKQTSNPAVTSR